MSPTPLVQPAIFQVVGGGLLFRDDFNRSAGPLGANWATLAGSGTVISSNQARITLPGANNSQRNGWTGDTTLDTAFLQIDVTDHGGNSQVPHLIGKWIEATGGYAAALNSFNDELRILRWNGSGFTTIANTAQNWDGAETGYMQLYVTDNVQEAFARNTTDSTTASANASDSTYTHEGYAGFGWGVGSAPVGDGHSDNFILCSHRNVTVTGMSSGYKAKIRNSGASVVAQATESSGTATVDASEYGGATEKVPYGGWTDMIITDGSDVTQKTISGPIYPGQAHVGA